MTIVATIAFITLVTVNLVMGVLLLLGRVRLVRLDRQDDLQPFHPVPEPFVYEVTAPDHKKRPGRPPKSGSKRMARHLYLPATITDDQLNDVSAFFDKHKTKNGDRVVLHVPTSEGVERDIEVAHLVVWNAYVKHDLGVLLGGWA